MAKAKNLEFEKADPVMDDEDDKTLAAIDEGLRDAKAGRTVPIEEVRKLLPKWIATPSSDNRSHLINGGNGGRSFSSDIKPQQKLGFSP